MNISELKTTAPERYDGLSGGSKTMKECENLTSLKLTIREIQAKLVEGCQCEARCVQNERSGFSMVEFLFLGLGVTEII